MVGGITIAIDRGGTFTDCVGNPGTGKQEDDVIIKLLSVDPSNYPDSNLEGVRRLLEIFTKTKIPRGEPLDTSNIESLRLGTTVATNALLERKGERCALITTKGFRDILEIGNQSRPNIFDLSISKPETLYETVVEISERVTLEDFVEDPKQKLTEPNGKELIKGLSNETIRVLEKPDPVEVKSVLQLLFDKGIRSIGVCLMHSYTFPDHELLVGKIAKEIGFTHVSLSCELSPMIKYVPRANSSVADAYLTPEIKRYLKGFQTGLKYGLSTGPDSKGLKCLFMQSDGGLVDATSFSGLRAILSGPAGGVVGYSKTCFNPKNNIPLIGFDMGGTSTDVSRFGDGKLDHVFETTTAGVIIQSPQLDINTVAAGGGSILAFKNGLMQVGPESASSHPGPACYRKGGPLTVTDANLFLGRLVPEYFPKIFGPNEDESLDFEVTKVKFLELAKEINDAHPNLPDMTAEEIAFGFLNVAVESMARPIRQLTESKGHVLKQHRLVSFGGAGGQCACAVAENLGINTILIHRYSSVLSAYGMSLADVVQEVQEPSAYILNESTNSILRERLEKLKSDAHASLTSQGFKDENIVFEEYLNLRYQGTESGIMVSKTPSPDVWDFEQRFFDSHKKEFGFLFEGKDLIVDDIRVRAIGKAVEIQDEYIDDQLEALTESNAIKPVTEDKVQFVKESYWHGKNLKTKIYRLEELPLGTEVPGPAIIADGTQTNVIPPNGKALVLKSHIVVTIETESTTKSNGHDLKEGEIAIEPVLLSIFGYRFMDIAEQMGTSLQKTSVSVNVKERLDFSCALFDADGNLVANAPHLPVHLGSMSTCIRAQANIWKDKLRPGDVIFTNHPSAGGTHLPDITVVTPAFDGDKLIFFVASRAHHSEIGGMLPGSMPPNSKQLWQEGAAIYSELLVDKGELRVDTITRVLLDEPAKYPGCSGTRKLSDNISDLKAQVAANQKGISLIAQLVKEFGLATIMTYMNAIQDNAAETVTKMLNRVVDEFGDRKIECTDYMDDGSQIQLKVYRDADDKGKIIFDFSGTSQQAYNNFNAPMAITYSAIIYCLRCLVDENIPLNQGCLRPINVIIPDSSLLNPDDGCAVVGGNVCTSQRVTDTVLKAFNVMADSQGDCNNFTFGSGGNDPVTGEYVQGFGYYETVAGGHGAGPTWHGISGVHTNMTNTRITDPEVFERRYPIIVNEFSIRKGSGGKGKFNGGDGVIREVEFRVPVSASILSERRVIAPHGIEGGEDGERGLNLLVKKIKDPQTGKMREQVINIGGRATVDIEVGDKIILNTPGGGGYGVYDESANGSELKKDLPEFKVAGNGSLQTRLQSQLTN